MKRRDGRAVQGPCGRPCAGVLHPHKGWLLGRTEASERKPVSTTGRRGRSPSSDATPAARGAGTACSDMPQRTLHNVPWGSRTALPHRRTAATAHSCRPKMSWQHSRLFLRTHSPGRTAAGRRTAEKPLFAPAAAFFVFFAAAAGAKIIAAHSRRGLGGLVRGLGLFAAAGIGKA